jgi:hypothetical protein
MSNGRWALAGAAMFAAAVLAACGPNYPPPPSAVDAGSTCRTHCTSLCFANCECAFQASGGGGPGSCVDNCIDDPSLCVVETDDAGSDAAAVDAHTDASTEDAADGATDAAPK